MLDTSRRSLHERVCECAGGADLFGVAAVEDTRGTPLYESATWLLPGARSIVVLGMEIFAEVANLVVIERQVGEASPGGLYQPHLDYLSGQLNRVIYGLARILHVEGYRALPLPPNGTPIDTRFQRAILSFKHAGEYAGLGSIGCSSLLITPRFGPRVRLACLLTDAELPASERIVEQTCTSCPGLCIANCPSGALSTPARGDSYGIDKFACSTYRQATACVTCLKTCPAGEVRR